MTLRKISSDGFPIECFVNNSEGITIGDVFARCGPISRITVDLGRVKLMEPEFMEKMRAKGRYVENWRKVLNGETDLGQRVAEYLDQDDVSRLAAVGVRLLYSYRPAVAERVFQ